MEQVVSTKPIAWAAVPDPFTLTGNSDWRDYSVAADVRFLSDGPASVMGRIDSADIFTDDKALYPSGYVLSVKPDGHWELLSAEFKKQTVTLAAGSATIDRGQWHHVELRFRGNRIEAFLDNWVVTCKSAAEARAAIAAAQQILEQLGVELHPQKTRVMHLRQGFEFLGYLIK